jgi:hypothetical protein
MSNRQKFNTPPLARVTTAPFDIRLLDDLDRFHLVMDGSTECQPRETRAAALRDETSTCGPTHVLDHRV